MYGIYTQVFEWCNYVVASERIPKEVLDNEDEITCVAVTGRKSIIALKVGCYFVYLATFKHELRSYSRQLLPPPDPLR